METPGGGAAGPADRAMRIDVVTLFPAMVAEAAKVGITGRAAGRGLWSLRCWNPRTRRQLVAARGAPSSC